MNAYFEQAASQYARRSDGGAWSLLRKKESDTVLPLLDLANATHLVDIGCGAGFYLERAREIFPSLSVEGCDRSPAMVDAARARGFQVALSDFLDFEPVREADRVVSAGMLEFVDEIGLFFARAGQWLSRGGRLVVLVPEAGALGKIYREFHRRRGNCVRLRGVADYQVAARRAGFTPLESRANFSFSRAISFAKESH